MKTRKFIFIFYLSVNILMFILYTLGYENLTPISKTLNLDLKFYFLNIVLLVSSLYILLKIFSVSEKYIKIKKMRIDLQSEKNAIGLFVFFIQLIFIFNFIFNSGTVIGKEDTSGGGIYGFIISGTQIIYLQIVYLVSIKKWNKIWYTIFYLFIIINIITGKSGFLLLLAVLFLFKMEEKQKLISYFKISIILGILVTVFYPIIYFAKLAIRIISGTDKSFSNLEILNNLANGSYVEFAFRSYTQLFERFEQYYLTLGSLVHYNQIVNAYHNNLIIPYYLEGFQLKIYKLLNEDYVGMSLGNYLPNIFYDDYYEGVDFWNISPGFQTLFYYDSLDILFIFPYYILLIVLIIIIFRLISVANLAYNFIFFYIILLLFAGWFSQFFYLVWSIIVLFMLVQLFGSLKLLFLKKRIV